jgi:RNA polymerase sigma factor (sigma-70 family)
MASDAELLSSFAGSGDEAAFAAIVRRHGAMVHRVCLRVLGDAHEAEDAAQAAFLVLVRQARNVRKGASLAAWLHGTARQVASEALRARSRRGRREEAAAMGGEQQAGPVSEAERREVLRILDAEVAALPERERQAVVLHYLDGLSQVEAAQAAGCPQGTIGRRASEGLERLRERLCRRGCVLGAAALASLLGAEAQAAAPASLLPSILAVPKLAAVGAAAGTAGSTVVSLAEGVMKAMFWAKVKVVAALLGAAAVVGTAVPVTYQAVRAAEPKKPDPVAEAPEQKDEALEFRVLGGLGEMKSAGYFVCRSEKELQGLPFGSSLPMRPDAAAEFAKQQAAQIAALGVKFEKEMVLVRAGSNNMDCTLKSVKVVKGEVHADFDLQPNVRGARFALAVNLVACPRRDLTVVFFENGKEVARVPFDAAPADAGADKAVRELLAGAELVVVGKVGQITAVPWKGPISHHNPSWQDAVFEVASTEKGTLDGKTVTVRFDASMDVARFSMPKLAEGQEAILILKKTDGLYVLDSRERVQSKDRLELVRKLLK